MLKGLAKGDVLIITRLDRLARSTRDLLNLIRQIADAGATFKSLKDAWADTTTAHGRLMLTVLAGLAEFERELIVERTSDGRDRAKAKGVVFGRKPKLTHHQRREALARREAGETLVDIARSYNVHHSMISRLDRTRRDRVRCPLAKAGKKPIANAAAESGWAQVCPYPGSALLRHLSSL